MNPFRETIVASPWVPAPVDVPAIHGQVFDECLRGIEHVRQSHRSAALLIHGEAGSGKTHLLSRLRARLTPQAPTATDREECLFVWVRLQTSPRMIWRTLRRTLVDDWFRPVCGLRSQFDRILFHRLAEIRVAEYDLEPWYEYMLDEDRDGLKQLMEQIAVKLDLDRNTAIAFEHIAFGRHIRDLRAWLRGDSLPEAALARIDLAPDEGTDEEQEDHSRQVVQMLCRLAGNDLPIVLSFDQVEALQMFPGDHDGLYAFGKMTSTLHDGTTNVLLVSCVQSTFAAELKVHVREADYARMTSFGTLSLAPLDRVQAEQLIAARLAAAVDPLPANVRQNPCWPLDSSEFAELVAKGDLSPRRLLGLCAERFETWARSAQNDRTSSADSTAIVLEPSRTETSLPNGEPVHDTTVETFLDEEWNARVEQSLSANRTELTEFILLSAVPSLVRLAVPQWKETSNEQLPDVALVFDGPAGRTGIAICTQSNMNSLNARLKRLKNQFTPRRLARLIVVRGAPLSKGATVTRQTLNELEGQGAVIAHPLAEVLAALDALRSLLSDAKSGDLARDGETLSQQTVEEWLKSHLPEKLAEFAQQLTGGSSTIVQPPAHDWLDLEELAALLAEQPVLPLDKASEQLKRPSATVVATIQRHPDRFGLLAGPPAVVFRVTNVAN